MGLGLNKSGIKINWYIYIDSIQEPELNWPFPAFRQRGTKSLLSAKLLKNRYSIKSTSFLCTLRIMNSISSFIFLSWISFFDADLLFYIRILGAFYLQISKYIWGNIIQKIHRIYLHLIFLGFFVCLMLQAVREVFSSSRALITKNYISIHKYARVIMCRSIVHIHWV